MFSPHFISFTLALGSAGLVWASQPPAAGIEQRVAVVEQGVGGLTAAFDLADINSPAVVMQAVSEANLQNIPGLGVIAEPGKPVLPAFSRFVVVPPDVGIAWEVDAGETHIIPAGEPIRAVDLGLDDRSDAFNLPIEVSGLYPQEPAAVSTPVVVRGVRLLRIDAYPLQYDGSNHTYIHHPNLQVRLRWTEDAPVNPVEYPVRRSHSKAFKKFISALAVNGPEVGRDDPDRDQPLKPGHYLIVTHENCLMHIVPFVEWRRKAGYAVDMLSLTAGDANNPDVVLEQIRNRYDAYLQRGLDPFAKSCWSATAHFIKEAQMLSGFSMLRAAILCGRIPAMPIISTAAWKATTTSPMSAFRAGFPAAKPRSNSPSDAPWRMKPIRFSTTPLGLAAQQSIRNIGVMMLIMNGVQASI